RHGAPPIVVSAERTDEELRIVVEDHGPGVAPELRGRLFEQFARAPGSTVPGTGLGLAIARAYAQAQGGDILHRDVSPSGSRFELVLPQPAVASPDSRMARRLATATASNFRCSSAARSNGTCSGRCDSTTRWSWPKMTSSNSTSISSGWSKL